MDRTQAKGTKEIVAYLDRIEELEDGSAEAIFLLEEEDDEYREFVLPADFLPEGAGEGEYLVIKISREQEKTQAALDEAKKLLGIRNEE